MNTCLIISGGEYSPLQNTITYSYVIACDKGVSFAHEMGITPDIIIGDFDSFDINMVNGLFPNVPIIQEPIRKDDTDTMLAIKYALSHGYNHIILSCVMGNRMDHTYANIQSMHYIASHGGTCEAFSHNEYMRTISQADGTVSIPSKNDEYSLSIFSLTDISKQVSIKGTEYDCITDLTNNFPLGLGNHFADSSAQISVEDGILLVIMSYMD